MLAFVLILALTAHSALAKPTGLCLYPCDTQASSSYTQPMGFGQTSSGLGQMGTGIGQMGSGLGQVGSGFGQTGSSFGQMGSSFGQMDSGFKNSYHGFMNGMQGMSGGMQGGMGGAGMTHGKLEDFGTVNVQPSYGSRVAQMPQYAPSVVGHSQRVESEVPMQPLIDGVFQHSSGKASFESNNGFMKIHQPALKQTVFSEPIIRQKMVNPCQISFDPCL